METQPQDLIARLLADHRKAEKTFTELDIIPLSDLEDYFCGLREELMRIALFRRVIAS
jgi:hypothetical protein